MDQLLNKRVQNVGDNDSSKLSFTPFYLQIWNRLRFKWRIILVTILLIISTFYKDITAQDETLKSGSFIINMGVIPQKINNALKPYGLIHELLRNGIPVKWIIEPTKSMDGVDFIYNGVEYKGGPFIIPTEFIDATISSIISTWQSDGVVGVYTTSDITVPVSKTLKSAPRWTFDFDNGDIAEAYVESAGIPNDQYNLKDPQSLDCCDDLYIMPHAYPEWETHSRLYSWNGPIGEIINGEEGCSGGIWLACHAGSAFELMFNPDNPSQQTNFLCTKNGIASGGGPYASPDNTLIHWGSHDDGTLPYIYDYPDDPIMQFIGIIDGATTNGSEQIYIPINGENWRAGAKKYVYDPNHPDGSEATVMVAGRAFDDPDRGLVMMEAAHKHNKSNNPENIAAQRAFLNWSFLASLERSVEPEISGIPVEYIIGQTSNISFTLPDGENPNDYSISWTSNCGGSFSPSNAASTSFTVPNEIGECIITIELVDDCGRIFIESIPIEIIDCVLNISPTTTNPSCIGDSDGTISMLITGGTAPFIYDYGTSTGNGTSITGLSANTYNITVTSSDDCSGIITTALTNPSEINISGVASEILCAGNATGSISTSITGGSPGYSFLWSDGFTTQNRSNLFAGSYTLTVTDANGCTISEVFIVNEVAGMNLSAVETDVLCAGDFNGSLDLTVAGSTGTPVFNWSNGATTEDISDLNSGSYTVTVTDPATSCTVVSTYAINEPSNIDISSSITDALCFGNSNGEIDITVIGGTPIYSFNWSTGATSEDLTGLMKGIYNLTVTDFNGCEIIQSYELSEPNLPLLIEGTSSNATCPGDSDGLIDVTVIGGTGPYTYDWNHNGLQDFDTDPEDLNAQSGLYTLIVTDVNGCTSSFTATIGNNNDEPQTPSSIDN